MCIRRIITSKFGAESLNLLNKAITDLNIDRSFFENKYEKNF